MAGGFLETYSLDYRGILNYLFFIEEFKWLSSKKERACWIQLEDGLFSEYADNLRLVVLVALYAGMAE